MDRLHRGGVDPHGVRARTLRRRPHRHRDPRDASRPRAGGIRDHPRDQAGVSDIQLNDPQTLYRRWEDSQWSPFAIDLSRDREQWPGIDPAVREIINFALSSLMV